MTIDVRIVLGASLKAPSQLSKQSLKNLDKLAEIGLEAPIILSGGFYKGNKNDTEASLMLNEVNKISEHLRSIYLETESRDSSENVQFSLDIIQEHGWKNIVIIDQPLHFFQLKLLFKHYIRLRQLDLNLIFVPAEGVYGGNVKWWQYSYSFVYFVYLALCTCYYILKGKITFLDIEAEFIR